LGLIEQWGSGVRRIFKEAEEQGLPEPQIVEIGMRLRFIVPLTEQITVQARTGQVTPEVRRMLAVITGEMTRGEIQESLGLKDEKHFRENYQQVGVKLGLIEMTIPGKPRSRLQKYRLTPKGKAVIDAQRLDDTEKGGRK